MIWILCLVNPIKDDGILSSKWKWKCGSLPLLKENVELGKA